MATAHRLLLRDSKIYHWHEAITSNVVAMLSIGVSQHAESLCLSEGVTSSSENWNSPIRLSQNVIVRQRLAASSKGTFNMVSGSEEFVNRCRLVTALWPA